MKKILFLLIAMIMVGCTVVETTEPDYYEETRCNYHFENDCGEEFIIKEEIMTEPDYYEETRCNYHFENDCGEEFIIKEEIMTAEKQYYYEHYYDRDYCGLYKLTYRDGCHGFVTYY